MSFKRFMHCARVDKSCSLVYTSIPKAGCTTIQSILANAWAQSVGKKLIHNSHTPTAREYLIYWNSPGRPPIQDLLEKCKFFTVSRNPYSRVLSAWMDKVKGATKEGVAFAEKFKIADPTNISFEKFIEPVTLGIAIGLFIGKQLGVILFCWLAIVFGLCRLPSGVNWKSLYGVGILCGIGFTMSLFIGGLAFEQSGDGNLTYYRLGILTGSLLSGIIGFIYLRLILPAKN